MINKEIIKFIFNDSKTINNNSFSWKFINQLSQVNIKDYEIGVDNVGTLYIWNNGIWYNGTWELGIWENGTWFNGVWDGGVWYNGTWLDGVWYKGSWMNGKWKDGIWKLGYWKKGYIYNPKTKQYKFSIESPNLCKWSLSYGK